MRVPWKIQGWLFWCAWLGGIYGPGFKILAASSPRDSKQNPRILEHPTDTIVPIDEAVTLNCRATGDPNPKIDWYKDGRLLTNQLTEPKSRRVHMPSGSLFFLHVEGGADSDAGTYWCVATNKLGTARSYNATLEIASLQNDFQVKPRNIQAVLGDQAMLECSPPKGYPKPTVTWWKNDKMLRVDELERYTVHPTGSLVISTVQQRDTGTYKCVAQNMVGTRDSNEVRLTVYEKPRFIREPEDQNSELGADVVFLCKVSGDPMPVIVWRKNGGKMPMGRAQIIKNRGLRIDRVTPRDAGEYVCEAKNPAGSIRASANLVVNSPPTFKLQPEDQTVEEGASALFDCVAEGIPHPDQFWSIEGEQNLLFPKTVSPDGRLSVNDEGQLAIQYVRPSDQGYYVCSALNFAGSNIARAFLKVKGRTLRRPPPPIISQGPANQTLPLNSMAILPCKLSSDKPVQLAWFKDNKQVQWDSRVLKLASGALQIHDTKIEDTGIYTCRVSNDDGETTWPASLTIASHTDPSVVFRRMPDPDRFPSPPSKPEVVNVSATSISLRWRTPNKQGYSAIIGYLIQYYTPENRKGWINVQGDVRQPHHVVTGLVPDTSYVFIVRAENGHGISDPSALSNVLRTLDNGPSRQHTTLNTAESSDIELAKKILTSQQMVKLLEVTPVNSTTVKLVWQIKQRDLPSFVQGFYIKWQSGRSAVQPDRWINVTSPAQTSQTVGGLHPYTTYKFFVIPYYKKVEGMPSNILDGTTKEAGPSSPPTDVSVRMMNLTTLRISWRPPPFSHINGVLKGYQIVVRGKSSQYHRNITTNDRAASVTLFRLIPDMTYSVQVAAFTAGGMGAFHGMDVVKMDAATLRAHMAMDQQRTINGRIQAFVKQTWFIVTLGVLAWLVCCAVAFFICWKRRRNAKHKGVKLPFVKISDGLSAREALWMDSYPPRTMNGGTLNMNGVLDGTLHMNDLTVNTVSDFNAAPPPYYDKNHPLLQQQANGTLNRQRRQQSENLLDLSNSSDHAYMQMSQQNLSTFHGMGALGGSGNCPNSSGGSHYQHYDNSAHAVGCGGGGYHNHHLHQGPAGGHNSHDYDCCRQGANQSPTPYATTTLAMGGRKPVDGGVSTHLYHDPAQIYDRRPSYPHDHGNFSGSGISPGMARRNYQQQQQASQHLNRQINCCPSPYSGESNPNLRTPPSGCGRGDGKGGGSSCGGESCCTGTTDPSPPHTEFSFIPSDLSINKAVAHGGNTCLLAHRGGTTGRRHKGPGPQQHLKSSHGGGASLSVGHPTPPMIPASLAAMGIDHRQHSQPQLLDFLPPPPEAPPPSDLGTPPSDMSPEIDRRRDTVGSGDYFDEDEDDFGGRSSGSGHPFYDQYRKRFGAEGGSGLVGGSDTQQHITNNFNNNGSTSNGYSPRFQSAMAQKQQQHSPGIHHSSNSRGASKESPLGGKLGPPGSATSGHRTNTNSNKQPPGSSLSSMRGTTPQLPHYHSHRSGTGGGGHRAGQSPRSSVNAQHNSMSSHQPCPSSSSHFPNVRDYDLNQMNELMKSFPASSNGSSSDQLGGSGGRTGNLVDIDTESEVGGSRDWGHNAMGSSSPVSDCPSGNCHQLGRELSPRSSYAEIADSKRSSMLASLATTEDSAGGSQSSLYEDEDEDDSFLPTPADLQEALSRAARRASRPRRESSPSDSDYEKIGQREYLSVHRKISHDNADESVYGTRPAQPCMGTALASALSQSSYDPCLPASGSQASKSPTTLSAIHGSSGSPSLRSPSTLVGTPSPGSGPRSNNLSSSANMTSSAIVAGSNNTAVSNPQGGGRGSNSIANGGVAKVACAAVRPTPHLRSSLPRPKTNTGTAGKNSNGTAINGGINSAIKLSTVTNGQRDMV